MSGETFFERMSRQSPAVEQLHIKFDMTLGGDLKERFEAECTKRGVEPAELMADIISAVIKDDLFAAVIDE